MLPHDPEKIGVHAADPGVELPGEAHGYLGRESVGHTLAEMVSWLDQFVKPAKPRTKAD